MSFLRASCSPNASQRSIWASHRGCVEGVFTAVRGVNSNTTCLSSLVRMKLVARHTSSKNLMFSKYEPTKHLAPLGRGRGWSHGHPPGRFEQELFAFPRQESKLRMLENPMFIRYSPNKDAGFVKQGRGVTKEEPGATSDQPGAAQE